jgi:hypothetical protein
MLVLDELTPHKNFIDRPFVLLIHDYFDRNASHTGKVVKKPKVILMFFDNATIYGLNFAILNSSEKGSHSTGGTT